MISSSKHQRLIEKASARYGIKFRLAAGIRMRHEHMTAHNIADDIEMTFNSDELTDFITSCDERKIKHLCEIARSIGDGELERLH